MALLALFACFLLVIGLVIALPVLNGIGSYHANPDGRKVAASQLEEREKQRRREKEESSGNQRGTTSSANQGVTGSSMFSRKSVAPFSEKKASELLPVANDNNLTNKNGNTENTPYGSGAQTSYVETDDTQDESQDQQSSYTPFDYQDQDQSTNTPSSASSIPSTISSLGNSLSNPQAFQSIKSKVSETIMNKRNPLKFTPTVAASNKRATTATTTTSTAAANEPIDATKPFSSNIDNEFDYDSFIEDQEKLDAVEDQWEKRQIELSDRKDKQEREIKDKLASDRLDSLA